MTKKRIRYQGLIWEVGEITCEIVGDPAHRAVYKFDRIIDNPDYVAPSEVTETAVGETEDAVGETESETESEEVSEEVGTEVFTCPTCGKTYTSESWFNKHLLTHE